MYTFWVGEILSSRHIYIYKQIKNELKLINGRFATKMELSWITWTIWQQSSTFYIKLCKIRISFKPNQTSIWFFQLYVNSILLLFHLFNYIPAGQVSNSHLKCLNPKQHYPQSLLVYLTVQVLEIIWPNNSFNTEFDSCIQLTFLLWSSLLPNMAFAQIHFWSF